MDNYCTSTHICYGHKMKDDERDEREDENRIKFLVRRYDKR